MFAVILVGGKQYKVSEKDELRIEKVDLEEGKKLDIKEVLLVGEDDGTKVKIGEPYVKGAHVECEVMEQGRGKKIKVFKMKPKKRYSVTQGHRQSYSLIKVLKISSVEKKAAAKKPAAKKEEKEEAKA
jgi:large subunit ribosomal protein L21